ncbi:MAG: cysteine desulfurase family protein [Candidatus Methanofastidiosia archaeon]
MNVYLDNAASTMVDPKVLDAMKPYFLESYGVATSDFGHIFGVKAREVLDESREKIASYINAKPEELIFTSGGTESNNLALKGLAYKAKEKGNHIMTSKIEHQSVLNTLRFLSKRGFDITYLDVDSEGFVDLEKLKSSMKPETILVSIQHVNQEIGTIQNISKIGRICRENEIPFHTDAVQSFGKIPIDVKDSKIDLMSISSHLIHGPKGVGALFVRGGVKLEEQITGGYNEFGLRAGTENIPSIVGFAKAVELLSEKQVSHMRSLRDTLLNELLKLPDTKLNGSKDERVCNNLNITFKYIEGESMLLHLDMRGIQVTTGSACFSRTLKPSHVILALGLKHEDAHGSVRFSLSRFNTRKEISYTIENVQEVVSQLRAISPFAR